MRLPRREVNEDNEGKPFLKEDTSKSIRISLDNLSNISYRNKQMSNGINGYFSANNEISRASILSKLKSITSLPLVRWIFLLFLLLTGFVLFSNFSFFNEISYISEPPELDFNLDNLISASIGLSQMAAQKIVEIKKSHRESTTSKGKTQEGVEEPVTLADKESNSIFVNGFRTLFGNSRSIGNEDGKNKNKLRIISEESDPPFKVVSPPLEYVTVDDKLLDPNHISIIIDPLDATQEFTEGTDANGHDLLHMVTTLICIVNDGTPIAGILNRPFVEEEHIIWGVVGKNKIENIAVRSPSEEQQKFVTISRTHSGDTGKTIKEHLPSQELLPVGGAGFKSWLVLRGEVDAYIHLTKIKIWDVCAGHALIKASGGDIRDKSNNELKYDESNQVFANGLIATLDTNKIDNYASKLKDIQLKIKA